MENKPFIKRFCGHFCTITKHKLTVQNLCFKCGLYRQGLAHDWSKYSPTEFWAGVKYYCGDRSPISKEKEQLGYSAAYLHHKGRNKHHWEYWVDRVFTSKKLTCIEMPFNYVIECVLDKIAASKVYKKEDYNTDYPYDFFLNSAECYIMNEKTSQTIQLLLLYLKENGEEKALQYYKELYHKWKLDKSFTLVK